MIGADVLKYGAIGIGAVILFYSANQLKQELSRKEVRSNAMKLIALYMAFSLGAFGLSAFLELRRQDDNAQRVEANVKLKLGALVQRLDADLVNKTFISMQNRVVMEDTAEWLVVSSVSELCNDLRGLWKELSLADKPRCSVGLLKYGEACDDQNRCRAVPFCYPYPDGKRYCLSPELNCAAPGRFGVRFGDIEKVGDQRYLCATGEGWKLVRQ